jgi:Uri superfamily endonuclease
MIRKGTYVLRICLGTDTEIQVGALGTLFFEKGIYCYVGSAMGGLDQRLRRHLSKDKRMKWHIDYLTMAVDSVSAFESYPQFIPECDLAHMCLDVGMTGMHKGFGCSDCRCLTHLFKATDEELANLIKAARLSPFE